MDIVTPGRVEARPETPTFGIREFTPYRRLLGRRDELLTEARAALRDAGVEPVGHGFMRLYVVDMRGEMEIECGFVVDGSAATGSFPAGRYAALTYRGGGVAGNTALFEWVAAQGIQLDRGESDVGDTFACRYEAFLTDPKLEPRKKQRDVEVAIKLAP